jgi:hypothetical protein
MLIYFPDCHSMMDCVMQASKYEARVFEQRLNQSPTTNMPNPTLMELDATNTAPHTNLHITNTHQQTCLLRLNATSKPNRIPYHGICLFDETKKQKIESGTCFYCRSGEHWVFNCSLVLNDNVTDNSKNRNNSTYVSINHAHTRHNQNH